MINKNEQKTHLYEYYSGVETPEDANNYSMDPEFENVDSNTPFEPSEPQYFAPLETSRASGDNGSSSSKRMIPVLPLLLSGRIQAPCRNVCI